MDVRYGYTPEPNQKRNIPDRRSPNRKQEIRNNPPDWGRCANKSPRSNCTISPKAALYILKSAETTDKVEASGMSDSTNEQNTVYALDGET